MKLLKLQVAYFNQNNNNVSILENTQIERQRVTEKSPLTLSSYFLPTI